MREAEPVSGVGCGEPLSPPAWLEGRRSTYPLGSRIPSPAFPDSNPVLCGPATDLQAHILGDGRHEGINVGNNPSTPGQGTDSRKGCLRAMHLG